MYTLTLNGLELNNDNYIISSIDGLYPPEATINTTKNGLNDGEIYNSAYLNPRQIIVTLAINYNAEENRLALYRALPVKKAVKVEYSNDSLNAVINGYVKSLNVDLFAQKEVAQITIDCPNPYFEDVSSISTEISNVTSLFEFPFESEGDDIIFGTVTDSTTATLVNNGVDCGMTIIFSGQGSDIKLVNTVTNEYLELDYELDGEIRVNTGFDKEITLINADATETNIASSLVVGSTWLKVHSGSNTFALTCNGDVECYITYTPLYEGV